MGDHLSQINSLNLKEKTRFWPANCVQSISWLFEIHTHTHTLSLSVSLSLSLSLNLCLSLTHTHIHKHTRMSILNVLDQKRLLFVHLQHILLSLIGNKDIIKMPKILKLLKVKLENNLVPVITPSIASSIHRVLLYSKYETHRYLVNY